QSTHVTTHCLDLFFSMFPQPPKSTLFPYTTLFRSLPHQPVVKDLVPDLTNFYAQHASVQPWLRTVTATPEKEWRQSKEDREKLEDRKSTRLNSSHVAISYAVFCLKKKKKTTIRSIF